MMYGSHSYILHSALKFSTYFGGFLHAYPYWDTHTVNILTQSPSLLRWPSATLWKMMSCFARNPLLLINDHNLSGPRLPFQPDCRWQRALPAWVAWWWYVLANTTCVRWRDKEGECRSSISKVLSLPKSLPGLVKGLTIFYEELGPWLGPKKAKKTTMTKPLTPPSPSFSKVVVVDAADAKTILCHTFVSNNYIFVSAVPDFLVGPWLFFYRMH